MPRPVHADTSERATITVYEDGPYLVRGDYGIRDQNGDQIDSRRRTVALCRCGRSKVRPFCDGAHRTSRFRAPGTRETFAVSPAGEGAPAPPSASPAASTPSEALDAIAAAHDSVLGLLDEHRPAGVRRAATLLAAARALMEWQLDAHDRPSHARSSAASGLDDARARTGEALRAAVRLTLEDAATADQVRSLLRDAASGLRPENGSTRGHRT